tara:strand:+ start:16804 stop:19170 length:2367 start_codon:yes stop_codon:yes gene_type:complete
MSQEIPKQKLPTSKKNKKWAIKCVEAFIGLADHTAHNISDRRGELKRLFDFYNGEIDEHDYNYVLKPYGKSRKNFPSKLRNYPILKPVIDLLLGEKSKRPFNFTVAVTNSDAIDLREEDKKSKLLAALRQMFVAKVQQAGQMEGMEPVDEAEIETPAHIAKEFNNTYVDMRALKGQQALNYIHQNNELEDKFRKGWFNFLVSGEVYTHRGVRNNEVFYEILNPLDVDYDLDPDLDFVEDGDWASVRKFSHASTIIDHFHDELTPEETSRLEDPEIYNTESSAWLSNKASESRRGESRLIEVINVYWKSRRRIGFLSFMDPNTGDMEEEIVPDGFEMPPELEEAGATIKWEWTNEVWEGTRIGKDIYVGLKPILNQRTSMDNPSRCKLPINGRRYSNYNSNNISLISLGIPYQLNYNIFKYRLEVAISKSKDIIAQFDINMIPKKWDMDKFMYYVDATGIAWVDYNKEGINLSPQHQSVLDLSIKTIEQYIVLLDSIIIEWERISGVNRQRQGQVGQYEGKSTSQQAIMQSSHITEDLFKKYSAMEKRDLQALLDYSKEAWVLGKKTMYVMPDGTSEFLSMDPVSHMESEYGVFVSDSGADLEKKLKVESLAQSMIQNGVPASLVAEAIDSDSFTQIKSKIKEAEAHMEQLGQAQQQAQQEAQQQQMQLEQMKMDNENLNKEKDRQVEIEKALISAEVSDKTEVEMEKITTAKEIKDREIEVKEKELELKKQEIAIKGDIQEEDARSNRADESIDIMKIQSGERVSNADRSADIRTSNADRKVKGSSEK